MESGIEAVEAEIPTDAYVKPSGGIPASDLASAVQTALTQAGTAVQTETDPTVPAWAKASTKPVYTAAEVGAYALPSGGIPASDLASAVQDSLSRADSALQTAPVTSVNGQTGAVVLAITTPKVTVSGSTPTQALDPNKFYVFGECTSLTVTLTAPTDTDIVNEYHFRFTSGSTATTLTLPATVVMPAGFTVEANKVYEISIVDNYGSVSEWATS